jgi:hypothetical protein
MLKAVDDAVALILRETHGNKNTGNQGKEYSYHILMVILEYNAFNGRLNY